MRLSFFRSRRLLTVCGTLLVLLILGSISPLRHAALVKFGEMLVVRETTDHADAIVISQDADGAGVLTAVDLVERGVSTRVAVFSDPPDAVDQEFLRRGVPYYNLAAVSQMQLRSLGVLNAEQIPRTALGTEDAAYKLVEWCRINGLKRVIFVVHTDHSRRARRLLDRAAAGMDLQLFVAPSKYSDFDPQTWWRERGSIRIQMIESQKLLFDVLRHPFS